MINVFLTKNALESVDVSKNLLLEGLYVGKNNIKGTIDISNLLRLKELYVQKNTNLKCIKRNPENNTLAIVTENNKDYNCN